MSYTAAVTELRQMLSDTAIHKRSSRKALLGDINGENKKFRTYDKRIIEDSLEVYVAGAKVSGTVVDDAVAGELSLASPPDKNTQVQASYYWQWWVDDEIKTFLNKGAEAVSQNSTATPDTAYLQIPSGLKNGALNLAAAIALRSLINFLIMRKHSQEFVIEQDVNNDENFGPSIDAMRRLADTYWDTGIAMRDDFYKRQGQRNVAAFAIKKGKITQYGPTR